MKLQQKLTLSVLLGVAVATLAACGGSDSNSNNAPNVGAFKSTVLVSDGSTSAPHTRRQPAKRLGYRVQSNRRSVGLR